MKLEEFLLFDENIFENYTKYINEIQPIFDSRLKNTEKIIALFDEVLNIYVIIYIKSRKM